MQKLHTLSGKNTLIQIVFFFIFSKTLGKLFSFRILVLVVLLPYIICILLKLSSPLNDHVELIIKCNLKICRSHFHLLVRSDLFLVESCVHENCDVGLMARACTLLRKNADFSRNQQSVLYKTDYQVTSMSHLQHWVLQCLWQCHTRSWPHRCRQQRLQERPRWAAVCARCHRAGTCTWSQRREPGSFCTRRPEAGEHRSPGLRSELVFQPPPTGAPCGEGSEEARGLNEAEYFRGKV